MLKVKLSVVNAENSELNKDTCQYIAATKNTCVKIRIRSAPRLLPIGNNAIQPCSP